MDSIDTLDKPMSFRMLTEVTYQYLFREGVCDGGWLQFDQSRTQNEQIVD
jgi:hypothetical protein